MNRRRNTQGPRNETLDPQLSLVPLVAGEDKHGRTKLKARVHLKRERETARAGNGQQRGGKAP